MQPLSGYRVLDLSHVLAGPFCTFQLGVMGADVIKIEPPERPDMTRGEGVNDAQNRAQYGTYYLPQNGQKRSLTLDLKTPGGQDVMQRLVRGAVPADRKLQRQHDLAAARAAGSFSRIAVMTRPQGDFRAISSAT